MKKSHYFFKNYKSLITVINYSKGTLFIIFLFLPVYCDLLNTGFKCREATSFETTSKLSLLILSKSWSFERYLSVDNKLILNQCPQGVLKFSVIHFDLKIVAVLCLNFNFMLVEENVYFSFFLISSDA